MKSLVMACATGLLLAAAGPNSGISAAPAEHAGQTLRTMSGDIIAVARRDRAKPVKKRSRAVRICRKWCAADLNPCDPPSFKIADGRCSWDDL